MRQINSVVLVGHENPGSLYLFRKIVENFPGVEFTVIKTTGLFYGKTILSSILKLVMKSSVLFCFVRFVDLVVFRLRGRSLARECRRLGIRIITTGDINSSNVIDQLKQIAPDLIVSMYTMHIYKQQILSVPRLGAITSHPSILPNYRGLEVFFWVMANDERTTGVSVFTLGTKIDSGLVIRDEVLAIGSEQSMSDVYNMVTECAGRLLVAAIHDINDDAAKYREPVGTGSYYPMPTRDAVRRFRRLGKRFF
jgi:hypothetical protein